jgi:hypothetical protein
MILVKIDSKIKIKYMKNLYIRQVFINLQKLKFKKMSLAVCLDKISGVFEPKYLSKDPLISDIYSSIQNLNYINAAQDRINMRGDLLSLENDFRKATKQASKKLKHGKASSTKLSCNIKET